MSLFILINKLTITLLTYNSLWSVWSISGNNVFPTFRTRTLIQRPWISEFHSFFMPLIRMFGWNREMVFYVEGKFLFDNLKWSSGNFTFYDPSQHFINIFLCHIITYLFFIILTNRKKSID